jgi:threonine dehydrogenase-like Zn-dependent dehydrogenase
MGCALSPAAALQSLMMETDTADMLNEMITSVRKGGRISIVGVYSGYVNHLNIGTAGRDSRLWVWGMHRSFLGSFGRLFGAVTVHNSLLDVVF